MEIGMESITSDLDFHPSSQLVAAGLWSGSLVVYGYAEDSGLKRVLNVYARNTSCEAVRFINERCVIHTGCLDPSILATDIETGERVFRLVHTDEWCSLRVLVNLTENTIASGDDKGCIKVWDIRQQSTCHSFQAHDEGINDITYEPDSMKLLGTSRDCTLSVYDLRNNKIETQSTMYNDDEPISIVIMKNSQKVICGTYGGNMLLYSWGAFKDFSDRFTCFSPNPVNALVKLDEERVIAGTENGLISVFSLVGMSPNRVIQPIAECSNAIQRLAFSHDRKFLGCTSFDNILKLWDIHSLLQDPGKTVKGKSAADNDAV